MPGKTASLAGRALLALALMIGFYLFALGLAALLVMIPVWEYQSLQRVHVKIALACGIGAALIVWSVLPRWDKFPPPGVPLRPHDQPDLFAAITGISQRTGQAMPAEVYLVPDVNAFVTQRGGVMEFFSRRVMGIGLPLLRILDVDQMRAVLAHEFGHFHGGDTRLGPWIYKTRSAIGRTIQSLANAQSVLTYPFRWYGNMFLRVTHAISRAQEFAADRLAARIVGSAPLASGLQLLPAAASLYGSYLDNEVGPVLNAGHRPPLAAGFQLFLRGKGIEKAVAEINQQAMQQTQADAYDTHPPMPQRVQAVAALPEWADAARDPRPALELLRDRERLERELLVFMTGRSKVGDLPTIAWRDVGEQVLARQWRESAGQWSALPTAPLAGATLAELPALVARRKEIGKACAAPEVPAKHHDAFGGYVLAVATGAALGRTGFATDAQPGDAVTMTRDGATFDPLAAVNGLIDGSLTEAAWREQCSAAGVADLPLAATG